MMFSNIRKVLKKNKFLYFAFKKLKSVDYKRTHAEYKNGSFKSKKQVNKELALIKAYWKCNPMHYFRYRLFDKELSKEELLDYIPPYYFYNVYMPTIYKGVDILSFDSKIFLNDFFLTKGIKTPKVIAIIKNNEILNDTNIIIDISCVFILMRNSEATKFFLKPDRGQGGEGIIVIEKENDELFYKNSKLSDVFLLKKFKKCDYILQEGVFQRKDISTINKSSINTLRVITQIKKGKPVISIVIMRIGRKNTHVDNSAKGGISVNINIVDGSLESLAKIEHGTGSFSTHPDNGFVFKGFKISDWDKIKEDVLKYAKLIPINEIAWDIAICTDGISVLEINMNYGIDHIQCTLEGARKLLDVYPN